MELDYQPDQHPSFGTDHHPLYPSAPPHAPPQIRYGPFELSSTLRLPPLGGSRWSSVPYAVCSTSCSTSECCGGAGGAPLNMGLRIRVLFSIYILLVVHLFADHIGHFLPPGTGRL